MDALTTIIDLASNSICAVLVVIVLLLMHAQNKRNAAQRDELERMVREILRSHNGSRE